MRVARILVACLLPCLYAGVNGAPAEEAARYSNAAQEFHDLVSTALTRNRAGRNDDALAMARRAEQLGSHTTLSATPTTAKTWNQLGILFFDLGFKGEAKRAYERGFDLAKNILPADDLLLANLHNNLGQVEQGLGNSRIARDHLQAAVKITKSLKQVSQGELAVTVDNLGLVEQALGNLEEAENLHKQALSLLLAERGKPDGDVATAWANLGMVYYSRQDYALAAEYLRLAFVSHQELYGPEHHETFRDIVSLTQAYIASGEESKADTVVNQLVACCDDTSSKSTLMAFAEACEHLASVGFGQAQLGLAERLAARAVALYGAATGPTAPETLKATFMLANILAAKGSFVAAQDRYVHLLNLYGPENAGDSARVRIELGKLIRDQGSFPAAIEMFQSAIKDLRGESPVAEENLASALGNLGQLYFFDDKPKLAKETYSEALGLLEHKKNSRERTWLLYNQAMLWYHLGEYDKARTGYEKVKALWASSLSADHPFVGTVAENVALVYWIKGDVTRARKSFAEANTILERQVQRILTVGTEWERLAYARTRHSALHKITSFCLASSAECRGETATLAATVVLQRKGRVLDAMTQSRAQIREHFEPADAALLYRLNKVRSEMAQVNDSVRSWDNRAKQVALEEKERQIESELSHRSALYRNRLGTVTAEMVVDALDAHTVLVEYIKYKRFDPVRTGKHSEHETEHYAAVVLRQQRDPQVIDLGPSTEIDEKVQLFRSKLQAANSRAVVTDNEASRGVGLDGAASEDYQVEARQLYQLLVAPIREILNNANLLHVAPDSSLNLIPFGLLSDAQNKRLSDLFLVNYLASGRDLLRESSSNGASPTVVVVANPDFGAKVPARVDSTSSRFEHRSGFRPLPGTHGEAEALQKLFGSITRLEGPAASVEAIKNISRPGVLHVATHGVFSTMTNAHLNWKTESIPLGKEILLLRSASPSASENPMLYSGLVLAGANRTDQPSNHSIMTAQDIANLDLRGTQLVVLSACETAVGTNNYGNEFAGLRRALTIAGSASQVSSLWKVNDKATEALMTEYYKLLVDGRGRVEALQLAQKHIQAIPQWSHPVFWAAFVPSGDWTPMNELLSKIRR